MQRYDSTRRVPRGHRRSARRGSEFFEEDSASAHEFDDEEPHSRRDDRSIDDESDDARILSELPPHWAVFTEREG
ncbi:hypothetical protein [uncultured Bifidobacterium sp.]|uniref:hypothetical protein n=1 Tax=uncultured Bifidobacterium sp. TaxID=165187 RepID=UPI0028DD1531|nr:hypothetical protein [uncultured Bifidobacterium sp.]